MPRTRKSTKTTQTQIEHLEYNTFEGDYSISDGKHKRQKVTIADYPEEVRDLYIEIRGKTYHRGSIPPHYQDYTDGAKVGGGVSILSFKDTNPSEKGSDE